MYISVDQPLCLSADMYISGTLSVKPAIHINA
uniref:Uncharacterized protein n=1 Tax=Anguilla anguilla TaxID=7936 RepID=A0A0E9VVD1_ANGAN